MNAKEEILEHIEGKDVELIRGVYNSDFDCSSEKVIQGGVEVIDQLDFLYDSGYGGQELFGYIWYKDGSWSERGEYDGSEWWEYKARPDLNINIEVRL